MQETPLDESNIIDSPPLWLVRYKTPIIAGTLLVAAAGIGIAARQMYLSSRESAAAVELAAALQPNTKLEVARRFLDTDAAAVALLSVAAEQLNKKDYAAAQSTYALFLAQYPKHMLANSARLGEAWALEGQGKIEEALTAFRTVGNRQPSDSYSPVGLLEAARLYQAKNDIPAARQALNDCIRVSGQSYYRLQAEEKLKELPSS